MSLGSLVSFTLRRRVTILMMVFATLLVGLASYFSLPVELLPEGLSEGTVSIRIPVSSSNPMEVQEQVIRPAEQELRTIPGIKELSSQARASRAGLRVTLASDVDIDLAVAEIRDRMERARLQWPEDVREYRIRRFDADTDIPIFAFAIDLDRYTDDVTFLVEENVIKPLETLPGVAQVTCWGLLDDQVRIFVDRDKALANGVGIYELQKALRDSNIEVSGGEIEEAGTRYTVRTEGRFANVEELRQWPVNDRGLRLGQIAKVEPVKAVREFMALSGNKRSLWCQVYKESSANTVETANRVRRIVSTDVAEDARLGELGAKVRFYPRADIGLTIVSALDNLRITAATGSVLALFVLFFFLRRLRFTVIITLAIPLSLLITLGVVWFSGGTLNILCMLGITVAIGMLIDNSIVVVENISRHREAGASPLVAAREGTSEVALAITLSTMTTVAAFLPIIFMSGAGQITFFFKGIGLPLCYAVLSSLLVALVFIPLATVLIYRGEAKAGTGGWRRSIAIDWTRDTYASVLQWVMGRRFVVTVAIVAIVLPLTSALWEAIPKAGMDSEGGGIRIGVRLDKNFTLRDAYNVMKRLGDFLDEGREEYDIEHFWCFFRRNGGRFSVDLSERDIRRTRDIAKRLKEALPEIPGVRLDLGLDEGSGGEKSKLRVNLFGPDAQQLLTCSQEVMERLEVIPGVMSTTCDLEEGAEEIHILPNREKVVRYGIDPRALRGTLAFGIRGSYFSDLVIDDREMPLIIEYEGASERTLDELRDFPIPSMDGSDVPLSTVASITVRRGFGEIRRQDGQARARITLETDSEGSSELSERIREALANHPLPPGYSFHEQKGAEVEEALSALVGAIILAVVFVFILMGILFESFILPLTVIVAIPFSWTGAFFVLWATDTSIDFVGFIGLIVLVGVVVNNGIVLIDCAHRLRIAGHARLEALVEAGRTRFRPIMMTAATTVVGLLPMAVAPNDASAISYEALSRGIIGGLVVSTFFTLFFVPILYSLFDDLRIRTGWLVSTSLRRAGAATPPLSEASSN